MPAAAKSQGKSDVECPHGTFNPLTGDCSLPLTSKTDEGSSTVFVNGIGAVRLDDKMAQHNAKNCGPHTPKLVEGSPTVFVNGKKMGRVNDKHEDDEVISTGSGNVFVNG
jgi:uncharacterized Zn-binding protein involved in type VI secretion